MNKRKYSTKKWVVDNIDKLALSTLTGCLVGIYKVDCKIKPNT